MNLENKAIYIPSRGRAQRQFTWERLPPKWRELTRIVVPQDEESVYMKYNPKAKILVAPVDGIGATRQWLIDNTYADYVLMFDDDLYFYKREEPMSIKLLTAEPEDVDRAIRTLFKWMEEKNFVHVALGSRQEVSFYLCKYREVTRANNAHGMNIRMLRALKESHGIRYDRMKVMEDYRVTLELLQLGYPNRIFFDVCWNQPGSHTDGGCSAYRTAEVQAKASRKLAKLFPKYVKAIEKKRIGETSWDGMKTRVDVQIQWRKAYLSSGRKPRKNWKTEYDALRSRYLGMKP